MDNQFQKPQSLAKTALRSPKASDAVKIRAIDAEAATHKVNKDADDKDKNRGLLGKFFGNKEYSHRNIAGLLIFILILIAALYTAYMTCHSCTETHTTHVLDFWDMLIPIITLSMGYIFGFSQGDRN